MRDQFKDEYETATVEDALGNQMKVKDIHCIITPSSLKFLKFSSVVGTEKDMYKHWGKLVKEEKCIFGVCKSEKPTKRGMLNGIPLQRQSYQMINSLPGTKEQIEELASFEIEYINKMKSDINTFIDHLQMTSNFTNANQMMIDLYHHNADFAKTELFNNFKIQTINQYILNVKKGKLRVIGDYCTIVGNPYEMLLHSIGKLDIHNLKSHSLQGAEVFTPLFEDGEALTGFRNPHSSANNILKVTNKHDVHIEKYFNLTKNTVAVNLIEFPLQDILSGSDQDGDTVLLSNDKTLHTITKECE